MKDLVIIIPTLFNRPQLLTNCVNNIKVAIKNTKLNVELKVVINKDTDEFRNWNIDVKKLSSNLQFNIAKAINVGIQDEDSKYYCFFDEGINIKDEKWIDIVVNMYNCPSLNVGTIGLRPHSTREIYCNPIKEEESKILGIPYPIENLLWSDGILFFSKEIYESVNKLDESYFGDCELQDFCYKIHMKNKLNYRIFLPMDHKQYGFDRKIENKIENEELFSLVKQSRNLFKKRWNLQNN